MKRIIAFILAITMMISLCACGNTSETAPTNPVSEEVETIEKKNIVEEILEVCTEALKKV